MAKGFKTGGRQAGTPNKATTEFKQTITAMLAKNASNVDLWLQRVAEGDPENGVRPDPGKALDLMSKLAEYAAPKLSRTEVAGDQDAPIKTVIQWEQ